MRPGKAGCAAKEQKLTARHNAPVLKPFEQIVGELIPGRRNKVFQVVTPVP
jgi:hypothetical protein